MIASGPLTLAIVAFRSRDAQDKGMMRTSYYGNIRTFPGFRRELFAISHPSFFQR